MSRYSQILAIGGGFSFGGVGLDEGRCLTDATKGAFGPPQQSEGARRAQSPEAMAIEDIPPGPTKSLSLFFLKFYFSKSRVLACFCVWMLPLKGSDR